MRKINLLLLFLTICTVCAMARPVSQSQALQKAQAFLLTKGTAAGTDLQLAYQGNRSSLHQSAPAKDAFYYVFNRGNDAGFVIVSGDDCTEEVLGYADSGVFTTEQMPDNLRAWLDSYADQIAWARANAMNANAQNGEDVEVSRRVIAPLVTAHWNQYEPYNLQCPLYGTGGETGDRCVTGCVAVALSQVMYYHRWPADACTAIPSYTSNGMIGTLPELPATTFDWKNMRDNYSINQSESDAERNAVAKLIRYTGQSVNMDYSPQGSGGYTTSIPDVLTDYFGYQNKASYIKHDDFSAADWFEIIYHELSKSRPVILGADTYSGGAHAFVCDGFDGHEMFHINWGWGGMADGYYRLQALNPSSQGAGGSNGYGGYSLRQGAVIGISPTVVTDKVESGVEDTPGIETVKFVLTNPNGWPNLSDQSMTDTYYPDYGLINFYIKYWFRRVDISQGYDAGLGLFKGDQLLESDALVTNYEGTSMQSNAKVGSITVGKNLADGTYQIKGIDCPTGTGKWVPNISSDLSYLNVEIANGQCTISIVNREATTSLSVTSVEQIVQHSGSPYQLRAHVRNNGEKEFNGILYLLVDGNLTAFENAFIPAGGEDYVDFVFSGSAGSHAIKIALGGDGSSKIYEGNVVLSNELTSPELTLVNAELKNVVESVQDNKVIYTQYGRVMELDIRVKNTASTDYHGQFTKEMWVKNTEGSNSGYTQTMNVTIPAGKEVTIPFTHDLALGDVYWVIIKDGRQQFFEKSPITVAPAFVSWTADGTRTAVAPGSSITVPDDAAAASFEDIDNLASITIVPNNNQNTLYYIAHNATVPTKLSDKNVVKGWESTGIELDEYYDYYVPKSFFTKEIRYKRVPMVGADGRNGWRTITLPFAVQKVTSGNGDAAKTVDWYHGDETDDSKDFWVREFKQVVGDVVEFQDVREWEPNAPYIIAVPGDHWGKQYDMTNQDLVFEASNTRVERTDVPAVVSDNYEFVGVTGETTVGTGKTCYVLNQEGNAFKAQSKGATLQRCSAYFTIRDRSIYAPTCLNIGNFDADGICLPQVKDIKNGMVDVFSVNGVKVATVSMNDGKADLSRLPQGIYIVEGTKIVK